MADIEGVKDPFLASRIGGRLVQRGVLTDEGPR